LPPPQAAPARTIEFDEAIRQAIERNPTIALAATAIEQANALLLRAQAVTYPTVVGTITNVTLNSARGFGDTVTQPQSQTNFGITASMPVLAFSRWAQVAASRDQIEVSTLASADTRRQIAVATAETYLNVIAARRQVEVDMRALETARTHLDYATRRLEGGAGSRLNQLRAAQEVSSGWLEIGAARLMMTDGRPATRRAFCATTVKDLLLLLARLVGRLGRVALALPLRGRSRRCWLLLLGCIRHRDILIMKKTK
jgi:outer membrane protein TolC